jgi:hypothetical protein
MLTVHLFIQKTERKSLAGPFSPFFKISIPAKKVPTTNSISQAKIILDFKTICLNPTTTNLSHSNFFDWSALTMTLKLLK